MTAEEIVALTRDNVQIFDVEPLRGGFDDDPEDNRLGTKILDWVNYVYRELAKDGIKQCFVTRELEVDRAIYPLPRSFGYIHEAALVDSSGRYTSLEFNTRKRLSMNMPEIHNAHSTRPREFYSGPNFFGVYPPPDETYTVRMLVEVMPDLLVAKTDVPTEIDEMYHNILVSGASTYIGRMALGKPTMNQFKLIRYKDIEKEYKDHRKELKREFNSRLVGTSYPPMMKEYREVEGYSVYRY